jgi:hypothetical protein
MAKPKTETVTEDPREQEPPKPAPPPEAHRNQVPIRVSRVTWERAVEISGPSASQGSVREFLQDVPGTLGRRQYVIEYLPWLRHFRVVDCARNAKPEERETFIHESRATSWRRSLHPAKPGDDPTRE